MTVIEVLPKEKKQKEEKTVVLGQCTVDLLPLVKGTCISFCCLIGNNAFVHNSRSYSILNTCTCTGMPIVV